MEDERQADSPEANHQASAGNDYPWFGQSLADHYNTYTSSFMIVVGVEASWGPRSLQPRRSYGLRHFSQPQGIIRLASRGLSDTSEGR